MWATLSIILPIFGIIFLGYLVGRTSLFSAEGVKGLTNFVLYIAMPCLLFRTMARLEAPDGADFSIILAYFGAALLNFGLAVAIGRFVFRHRLQEQALLGMTGTFSNTVLLGIPLVFAVFGESGMLPLLLIVSVHPLILISLPTILVEIARGRGTRWYRIVGTTALSLVRNPILLGMVAGLLFGQTGFELPQVADSFVRFLAQAGSPAALFAVGASLAAYRIAGDLREVGVALVLKLVTLPALVFVMTHVVFGLSPLWVAVATLNAAMPAGVNVFVLARTYDIYVARAASAILISTGLGWVSAAVLIALFLPLEVP